MDREENPIVQQSYQLCRLIHESTRHIAKAERFTVWQRCTNLSLELLETILIVGHLAPDGRKQQLIRASAKLDILRLLIRLAFDVKAIDQRRYLALQLEVDKIGKMLGGWLRSIRNPKQ